MKDKWKESYRRFRLRRGAGVERLSERDALRRARSECEPAHPGATRKIVYAIAAGLALVIAWPARLMWRKK